MSWGGAFGGGGVTRAPLKPSRPAQHAPARSRPTSAQIFHKLIGAPERPGCGQSNDAKGHASLHQSLPGRCRDRAPPSLYAPLWSSRQRPSSASSCAVDTSASTTGGTSGGTTGGQSGGTSGWQRPSSAPSCPADCDRHYMGGLLVAKSWRGDDRSDSQNSSAATASWVNNLQESYTSSLRLALDEEDRLLKLAVSRPGSAGQRPPLSEEIQKLQKLVALRKGRDSGSVAKAQRSCRTGLRQRLATFLRRLLSNKQLKLRLPVEVVLRLMSRQVAVVASASSVCC